MEDLGTGFMFCVLLVFVCVILFLVGFMVGTTSIAKECQKFEKTDIAGVLYECKKVEISRHVTN